MSTSMPFSFLENFGHSLRSQAFRYRVESVDEISATFRHAGKHQLTVTLRGAGRSYNDAAMNGGGIVLDLTGLNRILDWNPETGVITVEPGVTLRQVWQQVLPDGWWPPVVSGTMHTTLGGCLGANIHGKNNFRLGTIGEHVLAFSAALPSGAVITCTPKKNGDLFRAMIGGMGMLGAFTSVTLQMKRMDSGLLRVRAWNVPDLATHLEQILEAAPQHDYTVGWLDGTARGKGLGRGQLHTADYLHAGEDPQPGKTIQVAYQTLPTKFFGVIPKSLVHYFMSPFMNNLGTWGINTAKYLVGRDKTYIQPHAAFHFLLDYVPDWELGYGREGLIQYQSFLPKETAHDAWAEIIRLSHRRGLPTYLGVTKRHRPDKFLLSHALDGFSLAMDFKVTNSNRLRLAAMLQEFDLIVLDSGGRFYFAKNSETTPETARRFLGEDVLKKYRALKKRCDPQNILESDLFRRVFGQSG
ncbi:MAG: FAD-binding oxidoreductase [Chloroflexota bacterium]